MMWDPKNDSTADLLRFLERRPLDRMESSFQDWARDELKRRGAIDIGSNVTTREGVGKVVLLTRDNVTVQLVAGYTKAFDRGLVGSA